jgi:hypothetical protein
VAHRGPGRGPGDAWRLTSRSGRPARIFGALALSTWHPRSLEPGRCRGCDPLKHHHGDDQVGAASYRATRQPGALAPGRSATSAASTNEIFNFCGEPLHCFGQLEKLGPEFVELCLCCKVTTRAVHMVESRLNLVRNPGDWHAPKPTAGFRNRRSRQRGSARSVGYRSTRSASRLLTRRRPQRRGVFPGLPSGRFRIVLGRGAQERRRRRGLANRAELSELSDIAFESASEVGGTSKLGPLSEQPKPTSHAQGRAGAAGSGARGLSIPKCSDARWRASLRSVSMASRHQSGVITP